MNINIYRDGQQLGPYSPEEVREQIERGALEQDADLAWHEGLTEWLPLRQVLESLAAAPVETTSAVETAEPGPLFEWASDTIEPSKLSRRYQAGLGLVALAMILLPLLYLALCAVVGLGIFLWAVFALSLVTLHTIGIAIYLIVLFAGLLALVFLFKPLFHGRKKRDASVELVRAEHPELFKFIDEICRRVKAPRPVKVRLDANVNASASFQYGWFGMLTNRLVLTIGAPLAGGLTVAQLGGVIAHEFGHFTQAAAMRFSYVTRSMNGWFARVIFERDSWDVKLEVWSKRGHIYRIAMANLARGFVWLARKFLWLLMRLGVIISSFLMRQMEYDADHYELQVAGRNNFKETFVRLRVGNLGFQVAGSHVGRLKGENKFVDDILLLIHDVTVKVPARTVESVREALDADRSVAQRYATHPTDFERLTRAAEGPDTGALRGDRPALELFSNYEALCKKLTRAVYERQMQVNVQKGNVMPTQDYLADIAAKNARTDAVKSFFSGLLTDRRLIFPIPSPDSAATTFDEAKSRFEACERQLLENAATIEQLMEQVDKLRTKRANAIGAQTLITHGITVNLDLGLPDKRPETLERAIADYSTQIDALTASLAPHYQTAEDKLFWFCRLVEFPETSSMPQATRVTYLQSFLHFIHPIQKRLDPQRKPIFIAGVYVNNYQAAKNKQPIDRAFSELALEFAQVAGEIGQIAVKIPYPLADGNKCANLRDYFYAGQNQKGSMGHFILLRTIFERYNIIYMCAMQDLLEAGAGIAALQGTNS